jgi:hypothetical protein
MKKTAYWITSACIIAVLAIGISPITAMSGCEDTCDHTTKNKRSFSKCLDSCNKEAIAKANRERNMRNEKGAIITDEKVRKCSESCSGTLSTQNYSSCIQKCKNAAAGK